MKIENRKEVQGRTNAIRISFSFLSFILLVISSLLLIHLPEKVSSESVSKDLLFDEMADYLTSPYVDGGSGTTTDPFVIADMEMGYHKITVKDFSTNILFRNISFIADNSTITDQAFDISSGNEVTFKNITILSNRKFGTIDNVKSVYIENCLFNGTTPLYYSKNFIYFYRVINISLCNSSFNHISRTGEISSDMAFTFYTSSTSSLLIEGNHFFNFFCRISCTQSDIISVIRGNDLVNSEIYFSSGSGQQKVWSFLVQSNDFSGKLPDAQPNARGSISIYNMYVKEISNNHFRSAFGIHIRNLARELNYINKIENNTFEGCSPGILFDQESPSPYQEQHAIIKHNLFVNGTIGAIILEDSWVDNVIYNNLFVNNANPQVEDQNVQIPLNQWNYSGMGNYWSDHTSPDDDGDGIVDVPYDVGATNDSFPYTNPYLDGIRPTIERIEPISTILARSYIWVNWSADDEYGITKMEISRDNSTWSEIENSRQKSIYFTPDENHVYIKATDGNGLYRIRDEEFTLDKEYEVIEVVHPSDGSYLSDDPLTCTWAIEDYFNVTDQFISFDGERTDLSKTSRNIIFYPAEGPHIFNITITDEDGLSIVKSISFVIDRNAPSITVHSPKPFSILSCPQVNISFSIEDGVGLRSAQMMFDDGEWKDILGREFFKEFLDNGEHVINVKAVDRADHVTEVSVPFKVGENTNIVFTSPGANKYTKSNTYLIGWDYFGPIEWVSASLRVGKGSVFTDIEQQKSYNVVLDHEGEYDITLRIFDAYGNYGERTIELVRDITAPIVAIKDLGGFVNASSVNIGWNPIENYEVERCLVSVDEGDWTDVGNETSTVVDLVDGEHTVSVMVYDKAGNSGTGEMGFIVDTVVPEVAITLPEAGIYSNEPMTLITWTEFDNYGINSTILKVNDGSWIDVTGRTSQTITNSADGNVLVTIFVQDYAGNRDQDLVSYVSDLTFPTIGWTDVPDEFVNTSSVHLGWEVNDNIGLEKMELRINDEIQPLDLDQTSVDIELDEGSYEFKLRATDKAGNTYTSTLSFQVTIDRTKPVLSLGSDGCRVEDDMVMFEWSCSDPTSGIDVVEISVDGGDFIVQEEGRTSVQLGPFEPGDHILVIRVFDNAGNMERLTWSFTVDGGVSEEEEGGGSAVMIIVAVLIVILLVIAIAGAAGYLFIFKKRKEEPEKEGTEVTPAPPQPIIVVKAGPDMLLPIDSPQLQAKVQPVLPPAAPLVPVAPTKAQQSPPPVASKPVEQAPAASQSAPGNGLQTNFPPVTK